MPATTDPVGQRNKLRNLRVLQALAEVAPAPMGELAILQRLRTEPELSPTIEAVRESLIYLNESGLVFLVRAPETNWLAGAISETGQRWLDDPGDWGLELFSPAEKPLSPETSAGGQRSTILDLPPDVQAWLDQELLRLNFSGYSRLTNVLQSQGWEISRSAVGRYAKRKKTEIAQHREKAEVIRSLSDLFTQDAPALTAGAMGAALTAVFDAIQAQEYNVGKESLSSLAAAIPRLAKGLRETEKERIARDARRAALAEAEQAANRAASSAGLSADQRRELTRELLNIVA